MYEFYRGMEIHPRLMGVDVKQWTNCRVGMMAWQILIVAFLLAGDEHGEGLNAGHLANVVIQTVYIAKFFWWETGYFNTLDITLDRAGYYICWGCLVWVPAFYTYSSFYLVVHQSTFTSQTALVVGLLGNFSLPLTRPYCKWKGRLQITAEILLFSFEKSSLIEAHFPLSRAIVDHLIHDSHVRKRCATRLLNAKGKAMLFKDNIKNSVSSARLSILYGFG